MMKLYAYMDRRTGQVALAKFDVTEIGEHVIGTIDVTDPGESNNSRESVTVGGVVLDLGEPETCRHIARALLAKTDPPQKTVTKLAESRGPTGEGDRSGYIERFFIPANAKNIKCTYEVEE
jgi:hypothetical protein